MRPLRSIVTAIVFASFVALPASASAAGVSPKEASAAQREQAQARFVRGRELLAEKKPREALAEFEASTDVVDSPNARLYVARCHRALGNAPRAYRELARTERDARALQLDDPRYAQTADAAATERAELAHELVFLDVHLSGSSPDDRVRVGDEELSPRELSEPVAVAPGPTKVQWVSAGRVRGEQEISAAAGERRDVTLEAPPESDAETVPSEGRPPLRTAAYVAGGVAVAGLATFTIAGLLANGTYGDLRDACGAGPCPLGHQDDIDRGRTQQTVANVGLAVFAVAGAAAVTTFVLSRPKTPHAGTTVAGVAGPAFVGLRGSFR